MTESDAMTGSRLAHFMPIWHFREFHSLTLDAPREVVLQAAREVTWKEAPVARFFLLFTRNEITGDGKILDQFAAGGDTVLSTTHDEFVYGGIGSDAGPHTPELPMAEVFRDFGEPGYTKVGFNVRYADGKLTTETRVFATDEKTRARFGHYWFIIRVPSGFIRLALLHAIKKRLR